ncbi:hypothetical protein KKA23_00645 [Patescibacteria group bacterium]|nr:hypothetical protein [Patescibacteria group bacterium]
MEQKKNKNKKMIGIIIFLMILIVLIYWVSIEINEWWKYRRVYVEQGLASDKFPYRLYTEQELIEIGKFPEDLYSNIPTKIRPEETYDKFYQALVKEDFKKAAECFVEEQQIEWEAALNEIKEKGFLQEMINDLPEELEDTDRNLDAMSMSSYYYSLKDDPTREAHTIIFTKNRYGIWEIDGIY